MFVGNARAPRFALSREARSFINISAVLSDPKKLHLMYEGLVGPML